MPLPWWFKISAKIALSRLPVPYSVWRRLNLFKHGDMYDPNHALSVFQAHFGRAAGERALLPGFRCLELGPGDSLFSGIVAKAHGASVTYLIDNGDFAIRDAQPYLRFADELGRFGLTLPDLANCRTREEVMDRCGVVYLTEGMRSLARIQTGSIDLFWSNVVLEHVPSAEFPVLIRELRRVVSDGGVGSHSIDLKDHLDGGLNNLRFSDQTWESALMSKSGFYTNRIRFGEMIDIFKQSGFFVRVIDVYRWDELPLDREKMAPRFARLPVEDLRISAFEALLLPRPARTPMG